MVEDQVLDRAYAALADPTRRALLIALRAGDARISDLARPLPMSCAGVSRHVGVLEAAGLIRREVQGREHWLSVQPDGLRLAETWIQEQTSFWSGRAGALASRLKRRNRQQWAAASRPMSMPSCGPGCPGSRDNRPRWPGHRQYRRVRACGRSWAGSVPATRWWQ